MRAAQAWRRTRRRRAERSGDRRGQRLELAEQAGADKAEAESASSAKKLEVANALIKRLQADKEDLAQAVEMAFEHGGDS